MTENVELARLLAAATELDVKSEPSVEELLARNAELEAMLLAQADDPDVAAFEAGDDGPPPAPLVEPGDDGTDDAGAPGAADFEDYDDDEDGDEPDETDVALSAPTQGKADGWAPCSECGRGEADEYVDGTARCEWDGTPLTRLEGKGFDFDGLGADLDVQLLEAKTVGVLELAAEVLAPVEADDVEPVVVAQAKGLADLVAERKDSGL